jgi:hypothetical protein
VLDGDIWQILTSRGGLQELFEEIDALKDL